MGTTIDLAEMSKDRVGQPFLKYVESEEMTEKSAWAYFSLESPGPFTVASWISTGEHVQRIERTINSVKLGLSKVRLVAASQDENRKIKLDVWHPRNGRTKRFTASLASLKTGEFVQNILCDDSGIAYLTAPPDSYELRLYSVDYDEDKEQGSCLSSIERSSRFQQPAT